MLSLEWWAFEAFIFMAGAIGVLELASLTICLNVHGLLMRIPLGITEATGALLGNSIGANNVPLAERFFRLIFSISFVTMLLIGAVIVLARSQIVKLFSSEEDLSEMTLQAMIILGIRFLPVGLQAVLHGPIRALGLQARGSIVAFVSWIIVGLPVGAILSFKYDYGLNGLMIGLTSAAFFQLFSYYAVLTTKDWYDIARASKARVELDEQ